MLTPLLKKFFLLLCVSLLLQSCVPVYRSVYQYAKPKSGSALKCLNSCAATQTICKNSCHSVNESCLARNELSKNLNRLTDSMSNQSTYHPDNSSACEDNLYRCEHNCTVDYNQCYENCGGRVTEYTYCERNCDKADPATTKYPGLKN